MSILNNFKSLPKPTKRLLSLGIILALAIALPLFIWALVSQKFLINKKAATGEPTPEPRITVDIAGQPFVGPTDAPIVMVEFSDFECPFCKAFHDQTFSNLMAAYPNQIKFVYMNFPLSQIHPQAQMAAEASECAFQQNKFWEMHDLIFTNQATLADNSYAVFASQLGLNATTFNTCLSTHLTEPEVSSDHTKGVSYGVPGTPTFFINGLPIFGAAPLSVFQTLIDSELALLPPTLPEATYPASVETPTPSPTPIIIIGEPNSCGGTCGSNYNCKANLYCYQGYCRNPDCRTKTNCSCTSSTSTPSPKPKTASPRPTQTSEVVYLTPVPRRSSFFATNTPRAVETPIIGMAESKKTNLSFLLYFAAGSFITSLIFFGIGALNKNR